MNNESVKKELNDILFELFDIEDNEISDDVILGINDEGNDLCLDFFDMYDLYHEVNDRFMIYISEAEFTVVTYSDLVKLIESKL